MDCSIEVKSDNGIYFSTIESQYPAVLKDQQTFYDKDRNIFATESILVRDFPNHHLNL
jgi:hypothetical protein